MFLCHIGFLTPFKLTRKDGSKTKWDADLCADNGALIRDIERKIKLIYLQLSKFYPQNRDNDPKFSRRRVLMRTFLARLFLWKIRMQNLSRPPFCSIKMTNADFCLPKRQKKYLVNWTLVKKGKKQIYLNDTHAITKRRKGFLVH